MNGSSTAYSLLISLGLLACGCGRRANNEVATEVTDDTADKSPGKVGHGTAEVAALRPQGARDFLNRYLQRGAEACDDLCDYLVDDEGSIEALTLAVDYGAHRN